ncbi:MAG: hypothetical protein WCW36_01715 [Candidatus Paceibacterota bacterium]|jgi:hypothetical protein
MKTPNETQRTPVYYAESIKITGLKAGKFIQKMKLGLLLSNCSGNEPYGPNETNSYGFLVDDPNHREPGFIDYLFDRYSPRTLIGNLWFSNEARRVTHKKWLIEVFGREHVELFMDIANRLSEEFHVEVHVRLESEQTQLEFIPYLS